MSPDKLSTTHYGAYPEGEYPILLRYAFRPFFLLLPAYLILSIVLWSLYWAGVINLGFSDNIIEWHIYEMLFGLSGAGITGFLLTALPEFFKGTPIVGKTLLWLILLWIAARISFWLMDYIGIPIVALINLALPIWVGILVIKPIFSDPLKNHISLVAIIALLTTIQAWFFSVKLGWVIGDPLAILKVAVGAFMVLILLVLRRVNTGVINELFEKDKIDEVFIARPPRYNLAIMTVLLFTIIEFYNPNNTILAWVAFAIVAALLNITNDYFIDNVRVISRPLVWPLVAILLLMAIGYGLMAYDHLVDDFYGLNHFRHFLTTGALGLAYLMILSIVSMEHTGRALTVTPWLNVAIACIIIASILRGIIPFIPEYTLIFYTASSFIWASAFAIYLKIYAPNLLTTRQDGLKG